MTPPPDPGPLQRLIYRLARATVALLTSIVYRARAFGAHRVPARGGVLLVANHQSHLDGPLIGIAAHRPLWFVARVGLFSFKPFGWLLAALNSIPIRQGESDAAAIRALIARLDAGGAVLIFPEGSRTPDGSLQPFSRGTALLIKRTGCPVVPVAVEGCFDAWPRSRLLPRLWRRRVAVAFGEPIGHDELMRDGPDGALTRLAEEIESLRRGLVPFPR
ncbi:MAG: 1-acyl-sn-glycerol-3-phosphate acyltransferase [Phycisphaerae bacterium]|nr:1-acyl-sn-glycerol-3-phosphate acyltransferase [Phycisphaerae bacterium]